jgi:stage II sporulation protein R
MWLKPFLFTAAALALLVAAAPRAMPAPHRIRAAVRLDEPAHTPDVLRFRVIANSDTPYDQAVKIAVRNRVLGLLDRDLARAGSTAGAERLVRAKMSLITEAVARVLQEAHTGYSARVRLATTVFPTKAYGTWLLPAGRYHALVIVLGQGQGHNWWCVLFPSLCFIDLGNGLAVPADSAVQTTRGSVGGHPVTVVWWVPTWLQNVLAGL